MLKQEWEELTRNSVATAFIRSDIGKSVSIMKDEVMVDSKMRLVVWGDAGHSDCIGKILSVQEHEKGIVKLMCKCKQCIRETGGTCGTHHSCPPFQNAKCEQGKCVCADGKCAEGGKCVAHTNKFCKACKKAHRWNCERDQIKVLQNPLGTRGVKMWMLDSNGQKIGSIRHEVLARFL